MKKIALIMSLVLALLVQGACTKVSYVNHAVTPGPTAVSAKGHFFLWGLAGHKVIPAYSMCPGGVASARSKFTFVDLLLGSLTLGLYSPRTYNIRCGQ